MKISHVWIIVLDAKHKDSDLRLFGQDLRIGLELVFMLDLLALTLDLLALTHDLVVMTLDFLVLRLNLLALALLWTCWL